MFFRLVGYRDFAPHGASALSSRNQARMWRRKNRDAPGGNSNIFKKKPMSEKWGQKDEIFPLRSERGGVIVIRQEGSEDCPPCLSPPRQ